VQDRDLRLVIADLALRIEQLEAETERLEEENNQRAGLLHTLTEKIERLRARTVEDG